MQPLQALLLHLIWAPTSASLVETIEDDNSSLDSPVYASPSVSQAFAPSSQWCTFERITAHTGPLRCSHKRYLGSAFNLKALWSTGVSTWEPLDTFFQDTPRDVAIYAQQHNLLSNPHWKHAQDYVLHPHQSMTIVDIDDETELIDCTALDPDGPITEHHCCHKKLPMPPNIFDVF